VAEEEENGSSLADAREQFQQDIKAAYQQAALDGSNANGASARMMTIHNLASNMRDAIHTFMLQAAVATTVTIDPGQGDNSGGKTVTPGTGFGTGVLL